MASKLNEIIVRYDDFFGEICVEEFEEIDPMSNYTIHAAAAAAKC